METKINSAEHAKDDHGFSQLIAHAKKVAKEWLDITELNEQKKLRVLIAFEHVLKQDAAQPGFSTYARDIENYTIDHLRSIVQHHVGDNHHGQRGQAA